MAKGSHGRSMTAGLPALLMMAASAALIVPSVARWQENGWGAMVWIISFLVMIAIRTPHAIRNQANIVIEARKGIDERLLLTGMFLTMMALPLVQLATGAFAFADYDLPRGATVCGAILQVPLLWLFWRSHADLGRNWSPGLEVRRDHTLVTQGIYSHVRHPMYAAIWLAALTQPLLIHNWIAGALVVPAFAAMWFIRVPCEEAMMRERFGVTYDAYAARTGRLVPRLRA